MKKDDFPIVGLGASAGGIQSLKVFFRNLPETDACFVVVTHIPINHKTRLDDVISGFTPMHVSLLVNDVEPEPGHVYVLPGHLKVFLRGDKLTVEPRQNERMNRVIDDFFISLAESKNNQAIGIIFSGCGQDGAKGILQIHDHGGKVLVEDPESAEHSSMPSAAIAIDHPNEVVAGSRLGEKLVELISGSN